jgi:mxaL protein
MNFDYQKRMIATAATLALSMVLVAAAIWWPKVERNIDVMDLMFVIDITQSMNVKDAVVNGKKVDRVEWAKEFTHNTLMDLPCGTHAGLSIFSESRSLVLINPVEVCKNYDDLLNMLDRIDGTMAWANSSEVSKAVYRGIKQLKDITPVPSMVFVTDGHESPPLHKTLFPKFKGKIGEVPGVIVGVGGEDLLPIPKKDPDGNVIGVWDVNEVMHKDVYLSSRGDLQEQNERSGRTEHLSSQKSVHLDDLAIRVGFNYVASPENSDDVIDALKENANKRKQLVMTDIGPWLATIAIVLLVMVYLPTHLVKRQSAL